MEILRKITSERKDIINAHNSVESVSEHKDETVKMTGYIKMKDDTEKVIGCIKLADGTFINTISKTVIDSLDLIVESFDEKEIFEGVEITIHTKKSTKGREFYYVDVA